MKRYSFMEIELKDKYRFRCDYTAGFPFGMQMTLRSGDEVLLEYVYDLNADREKEISEVIFKLNDYLCKNGDGLLTEEEEIIFAKFVLIQIDMTKEEWKHTFELEIP